MALASITSKFTGIYDRLIAVLVLIGLMASLSYLALHVGRVRSSQAQFNAKIDRLTPKYPEAQPADVSAYQVALDAVSSPFSVDGAAWSNAMFVPETRVWCVDCRRPIRFDTEVCPFCRAQQPIDKDKDPERDLDGDGMKDMWENLYGLDPNDPSDAQTDRDNDGFTNIEEFYAKTDPADAGACPEITAKLCVSKLEADPFKLRFKSVIRLPGGDKKFAINTRGNARTYFKRLGEDVEGFEIHKYEPIYKEITQFGKKRKVNVSVLTLKRGDKLIHLTQGRDVEYKEYTAHLYFTVDGEVFTLNINDEFELRTKSYRLIGIDSERERVVIRRLLDDKDLDVRKCTEGDAGAVPGASPG